MKSSAFLFYLILGIACFLVSPPELRADTVFLKNGKKVEGKFNGVLDGHYQIVLENGKVVYVPAKEVRDVKISKTSSSSSAAKDKTQGWWIFPPIGLHFSAALGSAKVQYINEDIPGAQPIDKLGLDNLEGEVGSIEYPTYHSGLALQAAAKAHISAGPGASLQLGLDFNLLPKNSTDRNLTVDNVTFTTPRGTSGRADLVVEQKYTYAYFSLMVGLTSYIQAPDIYLSYYLRWPVSGSYWEKENTKGRLEVPALNVDEGVDINDTNKGSIEGRAIGIGFALRKDLFLWHGGIIGIELLYNIDQIRLKGEGGNSREEILVFYGLGLSMGF